MDFEEVEMGIPGYWKLSVAPLCVFKKRKWNLVGTCFFVSVYSTNRSIAVPYLVTAKHVYEDLKGKKSAVRLNLKEPTAKGERVCYLPLKSKWFFNSEPAVDLAVTPIETEATNIRAGAIPFDHILTAPDALIKEGNPWPPEEGEDLFYVASLYQNFPYSINLPVVRSAKIALTTGELLYGNYGEPTLYYLIESQIYPGNSGAPVWMVIHHKTEPAKKFPVFLGGLGFCSS
jgi:hypothetical protein